MFVVARTDAGRVRDTNQDRYLIWSLGVDAGDRAGQFGFCAVADGMGGAAAGDRASALTLKTLADLLLPTLAARCGEPDLGPCDVPRLLTEGVKAANQAVFEAASSDPALKGMGTTLTAGLVARGVLYLAQVGDSRCYRFRDGELEQLTADHSLVAELVTQGKLSPERVRSHPRRNVITRAIGVQERLEVDITCSVVEETDLYLYCSDGLWELVNETRITETLRGLPFPASTPAEEGGLLEAACESLVQAALRAGGDDNVTVLIAAVEERDLHREAIRDAQVFARTRVETASPSTVDLKRTLRHRLQEWQISSA